MVKEIKLTQGKIALVDDEDFEWLNQWKWCYAVSYAPSDLGYAVRRQRPMKSNIVMHSLIMNTPPGMVTDHIDGNSLNNQRKNLRITNHAGNRCNAKKQQGCSSKYKGVAWWTAQKQWRAYIKIDGKTKHLGAFPNEIECAKAYNEAAIEYFGEFAKLNEL